MMWRHMTVGAAEVERTCRSKQGDEVSAAAEIKERITFVFRLRHVE